MHGLYLAGSLCELPCFGAPLLLFKQTGNQTHCEITPLCNEPIPKSSSDRPVIIFVCDVGVVNRVLPDHLILPARTEWNENLILSRIR